jgi:hypothetical protein
MVPEIGSHNALIEFVRRNTQRICFGSAVYHMAIHPVQPLDAYIQHARQLINTGNATVTSRINGEIEIEFSQVNGDTCSTYSVVIFPGTKNVILCTYNPRKT